MDPNNSTTYTHEHTDSSALSEVESLSDSEWLDVSGRESDSDSICSSRGTDHRRTSSLSRSRRSSISYGSSREGDVDAWEGLIEDSADEGPVSDTVRFSNSTVAFRQDHFTTSIDEHTGDATEEQRVKEGLDQSMISTLSSSRSSSVHASTVINPSRDLRLSFPDPITSSHEELLNIQCEDISPGATFSGTDPDLTMHLTEQESPDLSHSLESSSAPIIIDPAFASLNSDLNIVLYGLPYSSKWSFVSKLLEKAVRGARLTIATPVEQMDGPVRQLHIEGGTSQSIFFPRIITIFDRTHSTQGDNEDSFVNFSTVQPSLAIVFLPFSPLQLPEHTSYLPVIFPGSCAIDNTQSEDAILTSAQETWDLFNISNDRILRLSDFAPCVVNADVIDTLPPYRAYRAFDRVSSRGRKKSDKLLTHSPHALTIFTMVSLVLGVVVGSTFHVTAPVVTPASVTTAMTPVTTTPPLWALLRPIDSNQSHGSISAKSEPSTISMHSSLKDIALSTHNPDSTTTSISQESPTSGFRCMSSFSEKLKITKDVVLRPTSSLMSLEGRTKSLSVVPDEISSLPHEEEAAPTPSSSALTTSTLGLRFFEDTLPKVMDAYAPDVVAVVNSDMQDIIDALDSLVQAISRQAHVLIAQTNALIRHSTSQGERSTQDLEAIRGALTTGHERAQRRAKELKDHGAQWFYETGEALMNRASRASEKAKEITEDFEKIWVDSNFFMEKWEVCKMRSVGKGAGRETRKKCCNRGKEHRGPPRSKRFSSGGWLTHVQYC